MLIKRMVMLLVSVFYLALMCAIFFYCYHHPDAVGGQSHRG